MPLTFLGGGGGGLVTMGLAKRVRVSSFFLMSAHTSTGSSVFRRLLCAVSFSESQPSAFWHSAITCKKTTCDQAVFSHELKRGLHHVSQRITCHIKTAVLCSCSPRPVVSSNHDNTSSRKEAKMFMGAQPPFKTVSPGALHAGGRQTLANFFPALHVSQADLPQ